MLKNVMLFTKKYLFIFMIFILFYFSCFQDVIDIDLSHIGPQVVIEGSVTDQPGPYTVMISKKGDYLRPTDVYPPVTGATVAISDNEGNSETLREMDDGIYRTIMFQGFPGRSYTLKVNAEGNEYSATSAMPVPIELDSLRFVRRSYYTSDYYLKFYFTDHESIEDNCRFIIYRNGNLIDNDYHLYNDEFTDGQQILIDYFEDFNFTYHDEVRLEILSFDRTSYDFYSSLKAIIIEDDDEGVFVEDDELEAEVDDETAAMIFFPVTLFNPTTNLSANAIGYFSAVTIRTYTFFVE